MQGILETLATNANGELLIGGAFTDITNQTTPQSLFNIGRVSQTSNWVQVATNTAPFNTPLANTDPALFTGVPQCVFDIIFDTYSRAIILGMFRGQAGTLPRLIARTSGALTGPGSDAGLWTQVAPINTAAPPAGNGDSEVFANPNASLHEGRFIPSLDLRMDCPDNC